MYITVDDLSTISFINLQINKKRQLPSIKRASLQPLRGAAGDHVHLSEWIAFAVFQSFAS
jgi:hypothetical protein